MKVYVIHGSPLSGKTTYVNNHKGDNDLVYDFDILMSALSGKEIHERNNNLIDYVIDIRDLVIAKLKSETEIDTAWIISTRVTGELKDLLVGLNPIYKEIKIDIRTAKQRLVNDPAGRDIEEWSGAIDRYFISTKDYTCFHQLPVWHSKRIAILKRDGYLCRECKRYGKTTEANTVHHIIPVEERPDLRLVNNNLLSLCESCHEAMHNKFKDRLSKLGVEWRERVVSKHRELTPPGLSG